MNSKNTLSIDHLNMTVHDLAESEAWYKKVFGFERVEHGKRNGEPWAILRSGELMLCLYEQARTPPLNETSDDWHKGPLKIWHFGLRVRDKVAWEKTVETYKIPVEYGGPVRYPHSLSWYVSDPSGHEIEVAYWDNDEVKFD